MRAPDRSISRLQRRIWSIDTTRRFGSEERPGVGDNRRADQFTAATLVLVPDFTVLLITSVTLTFSLIFLTHVLIVICSLHSSDRRIFADAMVR